MKAPSTELHRKVRKMRPKGGGPRRKIWKASKDVWNPCNPLKSHKTAKDLFGKAWSKTRDFWEKLEKRLGGRLYSATVGSLPPAASARAGSSLRGAKRRSNPGVASRGPWVASLRKSFVLEKRPESTEKRKARFIQGDRLEDGAKLAMTTSSGVASSTRPGGERNALCSGQRRVPCA